MERSSMDMNSPLQCLTVCLSTRVDIEPTSAVSGTSYHIHGRGQEDSIIRGLELTVRGSSTTTKCQSKMTLAVPYNDDDIGSAVRSLVPLISRVSSVEC